jgi:hypothetical protein
MPRQILYIPTTTGNSIAVIDIDFEKKLIFYRRGFNPAQLIQERYEVFGDTLRTGLIYFQNVWLDRWKELNDDEAELNEYLNKKEEESGWNL